MKRDSAGLRIDGNPHSLRLGTLFEVMFVVPEARVPAFWGCEEEGTMFHSRKQLQLAGDGDDFQVPVGPWKTRDTW